MRPLVVYDTNIFVSYLLSPDKSGTIRTIVEQISQKQTIPVFSNAIMTEYERVLHYRKFRFSHDSIQTMLDFICENGLCVTPEPTGVPFVDESDKPFYEAALSSGADWLVTGNKRRLRKANAVSPPRASS